MTREELLKKALSTIDPSAFASYTEPDIIVLSGIDFKLWNTMEQMVTAGNKLVKQYRASYQAQTANTNGEYPVFTVAVIRKERKVKGGYKITFEYDYSPLSGTRFSY